MEIEERTLKFREDVLAALAAIQEQNQTQFKRLDKIEKMLIGNGHPGLLTRVSNLEQNWKWAKWTAAAIGAFAGILVNILTSLLKGN